jgi:L,D-transpeptidase catalytic domain
MNASTKISTLFLMASLLGACSSHKPTTTTAIAARPQHHAVRSSYIPLKLPGQWTVGDVLQTYGERVKGKLSHYFTKANVAYPPREAIFIALKQERKLELWARNSGKFRFIRDYYILAASGDAGPKLRQGDRQVPEGIYRIVELNPNSHYHLSMKINYPNEFDLFHAELDGRNNLGSDIFIHGKDASLGCLAMGDEAINELFVLAAQTGPDNVKVVIAPRDPRAYPLQADPDVLPDWAAELYALISQEIQTFAPAAKSAKTGLSIFTQP